LLEPVEPRGQGSDLGSNCGDLGARAGLAGGGIDEYQEGYNSSRG
jgi:hypothetical protein